MGLVAQFVPIDGGGSILLGSSESTDSADAFDDTLRSLCNWPRVEGDTLSTI